MGEYDSSGRAEEERKMNDEELRLLEEDPYYRKLWKATALQNNALKSMHFALTSVFPGPALDQLEKDLHEIDEVLNS